MSPGARRNAKKRGSASSNDGLRRPFSSPPFLLLGLLLIVGTVGTIVHWPVLHAKADCFDDFQYIDENPLVMNPSWESAERFLREIAKPSTVTGYYQPLTMISLMLDVAAGASPEDKRLFHATSLALHIANTVMIGLLLFALFRNAWAAAGAALLFGLHPMTVEPIAWSSERKTLLSSFFALASLLCFVAYARRSDGGDRSKQYSRGSRTWLPYAAALIAYLMALLAKPTATTLPAAILLLSYWPLRRLLVEDREVGSERTREGRRFLSPLRSMRVRVLLELVPFLVVGTTSAVVTYISQRDAGGVATPGGGYDVGRIPLILAYDVYLYGRNVLWPRFLVPHNPFPDPVGLTNARIAAGLVLSVAGIGLVLASLRRTRALFTGAAIVFVLILPTLQLVQFSYSVVSDKYFYLPALGLLLILAWALDGCFAHRSWFAGSTKPGEMEPRRAAGAFLRSPRGGLLLLAVAIGVIAIAEIAGTRRQLGYWATTESLDRRLIALDPENSEFHFDLGNALWDQGRLEEAHRELEAAVELDSTNVRALNNLALSAAFRDEGPRAIELWQQTLRHHSGNYVARCNLAFYDLERNGRIAEALEQYSHALKDYLDEKEQGRRAQAVGRADPGAPSQVYAMLGHAHFLLGHFEPALEHLRKAITLPQPIPLAFHWLAETLVAASGSRAVGEEDDPPRVALDPEAAGNSEAEEAALREFRRVLDSSGPGRAFSSLANSLRAQGRQNEASVASEIATALGQERTSGVR